MFENIFKKNLINKSKLNLTLIISTLLIIPTYLTGPFLPDLFLSFSAIIFLIISFKQNLKKFYLNGYSKFFGIFFLYIIINSLFSPYPEISLKSSGFYFRFYLFSLAIWYLISTEVFFRKILFNVINLTLIFVLVDTFIQYLFGFDLFRFEAYTYRLSGPFDEELIVGSFIAKILPILLSLYFLINQKISYKMLFLFLASIIVTFLSGERTSFFMISFFALFFLYFVHVDRKKYVLFFSITVLLLSIISTLIFDKTRFDRMVRYPVCAMNLFLLEELDCKKKENFYGQLTDKKRIIVFSIAHEGHYEAAIRMFLDAPIFGQGIKMFRYLCEDKKFKNLNSCTTHPHNTLLQILAEIGLIGGAFLFFVIFKIYQTFFKLIFSKKISINKNEKLSFIIINLAMIQVFLIFLPSGQFFNNYLSILYYFPLGIFLNFHYNHIDGK